MLAYHGKQATKDRYLNRVKQHREADELIQGYGYWSDGKGCAVGCTLHKGGSPHRHYESELGIPERIAHLEDAIFEGLPVDDAKLWPERFLSAITPGADLSLVWHRFAVWLLRDSELLTITDVNREAIAAVLAIHVRAASGEQPSRDDWSAAWSAAESAAESAWSAAWSAAGSAARSAWSAWSAARSAWSAAESAESAARSARSAARSAAESAARSAESAARSAAESAAWSAAESAESAARSAWSAAWSAYQKMADKLIELLESAPASGREGG